MQHEIASQIAAEAPISSDTLGRLRADYGISPGRLEQNQRAHRMVLDIGYGELESMLEMSRPEASDPVTGYHDDPPAPKNRFEQEYDTIRHSPMQKLLFDREYIDGFLRKLGPTNTLRRPDGLDSSFELGRMRRLLQNDYDALPERKKRPELRMTEALIGEELALLWSPTAVQNAAKAPAEVRPLIANTKDVNVVKPSQIESMPARDRWKLVGARLSAEAAELFRSIAASPTIKAGDRLEATCRAADMEIRQLRILSNMSMSGDQRRALNDQLEQVTDATLQTMVNAWLDLGVKKEVGADKLFELLVVVNERRKLMESSTAQQLVRFALPREDKVHARIGMLASHGRKIDLSADVIVEDISTGKFVAGYQAKSVPPEKYAAAQAADVAEGRRPKEYDIGRIAGLRYVTDEDMRALVGQS